MNITVNSQLLAQELRLLSKITPDKPTIPVLANTLLRAQEDSLSFHVTDLQLGLVSTCPATVTTPGVVTLPVKKLLEMVEQLANADVHLLLERNSVTVTCGAFKSRLQTLPTADFPTLPTVEGEVISLSGLALRLLIDRTKYAISEKAQKFVLDGALLTLAGDVMAMVATDGKRLSLSTASRVVGPDLSSTFPSHTLDALLTLMGPGDLTFSVGSRHLFFTVGGRLLISRTLDGKFPSYERIIPRNNDKIVTVDRSAFASALRRVGTVADQDNSVYLTLSGESLSLTSSSAAVGDATEHVAVAYDGPDVKLCVNGVYVLEFLEAARGESVTLAVKDGKSAVLLSDGVDFINVVMTMRVQ